MGCSFDGAAWASCVAAHCVAFDNILLEGAAVDALVAENVRLRGRQDGGADLEVEATGGHTGASSITAAIERRRAAIASLADTNLSEDERARFSLNSELARARFESSRVNGILALK